MIRSISLFLFFILLLMSSNLKAQFAENNAIYGSLEIFGGNYFGASMNVNYVSQEKYSFQLGFFSSEKTCLSALKLHFRIFWSLAFWIGKSL
ncbi:MAG: hypothetical protein ACQEWG_11760 [Bacteroidota bacterium]